jgi:hypothetical protein
MTTNTPEVGPIAAVDEKRRVQVEAELRRILISPGFRTSKRSQEFLRYIVSTSLDGRFDELKERVIGIRVFERLPDYDTGEHSIVRVKANELRKRLAQFYSESNEPSVVEIHLPKGSYTPEYRWTNIEEPKPVLGSEQFEQDQLKEQKSAYSLSWSAGAVALLSVLSVMVWYFVHDGLPKNAVEQFWQPVLHNENTPLLCIGSPEIWRVNESLLIQGSLPATIPPSAVFHDVDHYVGWGNAVALTQLGVFFARHGKEAPVRLADDVSFSELSLSPVVLIGARSNAWTMQLANGMRFFIDRSDQTSVIRDKTTGKEWKYRSGAPSIDYVVISRIFESKTGRMIVLAAGLSHYGTQTAGKILTDPVLLQKALQGAPKDWAKRDLQLVFRVEIFGRTAGEPKLEASNFR